MSTMHPTLFLPMGFRQAVTVLLAIIPFISAAPPDSQNSRRELHFRDYLIPQRDGLPPGWVKQSCYSDNPSARTLTSVALVSQYMTVGVCIGTCSVNNLALAGLGNGTSCYCGNVTTAGSTYTSPGDCDKICPGNSTQNCGGISSLSLWANTDIPRQADPTFAPNVGKWTLSGCYSDSNTDRTLPFQVLDGFGPGFREYNNSPELCVSTCEKAGYSVAGMELALQCWCGTTTNPAKKLDNSKCMLACPGNTRVFCGGQNSLVIYSSLPH